MLSYKASLNNLKKTKILHTKYGPQPKRNEIRNNEKMKFRKFIIMWKLTHF